MEWRESEGRKKTLNYFAYSKDGTSEPRLENCEGVRVGTIAVERNKSAINKLSSDNMKLYILRLVAYDSRSRRFSFYIVLERRYRPGWGFAESTGKSSGIIMKILIGIW